MNPTTSDPPPLFLSDLVHARLNTQSAHGHPVTIDGKEIFARPVVMVALYHPGATVPYLTLPAVRWDFHPYEPRTATEPPRFPAFAVGAVVPSIAAATAPPALPVESADRPPAIRPDPLELHPSRYWAHARTDGQAIEPVASDLPPVPKLEALYLHRPPTPTPETNS